MMARLCPRCAGVGWSRLFEEMSVKHLAEDVGGLGRVGGLGQDAEEC